jgi:hypothetical protein
MDPLLASPGETFFDQRRGGGRLLTVNLGVARAAQWNRSGTPEDLRDDVVVMFGWSVAFKTGRQPFLLF